MTYLAGRMFPVRLENPLIGGRRLYKGKGRSGMSYWARNRNQLTRNPPTHPLFSRVDFSEQQPFPSLHFVPDRAPVAVAHPYLINDNNIDRILYYSIWNSTSIYTEILVQYHSKATDTVCSIKLKREEFLYITTIFNFQAECVLIYMLLFYQISAWVFLIHMFLYASFYCSVYCGVISVLST